MAYNLTKYNDRWFKCYEKEKELLESKLANFHVASIEHIGATSAVLCDTLGTIDILVGIDDIVELDTIKHHLKHNGYDLIKNASTRTSLYFVRREEKGIVCTVRVLVNGSKQYQYILAFRNYLRANKYRALRYNEYRKTVLEGCKGNLAVYAKFKANFIQSIIEEFCVFEQY